MDYLCCPVARRRWHGERCAVRSSQELLRSRANLLCSRAVLCGSVCQRLCSDVCRSRGVRSELCRSGLLRQRLRQRLLQEELLEVPEAVPAEAVPAEVPPAQVVLLQEELLRWLCEKLRPDVRRSSQLCSDLRRSDLCRSVSSADVNCVGY